MIIKQKAYYLIGFFFFLIHFVIGQDQNLADSLIMEYDSGLPYKEELLVLKKIAIEETRPERKFEYSELLIEKASKDSLFEYLYSGYLHKGNALQFLGNNAPALESFFKSLEYANRIEDEKAIGSLMISIADTYTNMGSPNNAQNYYSKGIRILREVNDSIKIATALLNAGDAHFNNGNLDSAIIYTQESAMIFDRINFALGKAYSLGNMGMANAEQEKYSLAEQQISDAIQILEKLEDYYPISVYLTYMADIYVRKKDFPTALRYANESLELASLYGLKEQIGDAHLKLSEIYEQSGEIESSFKHFKDHIVYRDSVKNIENVQKMADQRTNYEIGQKQIEVDLAEQRRKNQRNISLAIALGLIILALVVIGLFRRNKFIMRTKEIIEKEKERSDKLLLNILPKETAQELKEKGRVTAKKHDAVTVLFSDFKGFTSYSEKLSPETLVEMVDFYFSKFDAIVKKYGLEKIKTIGDAYMCAGGLHDNEEDHARRMVLAAKEIVAFVEKKKNDETAIQMTFDIRVGINTGPVVAGVVGTDKFAYDIWGDTVNIASRMESNSQPGKINVSENTYELLKDDFEFRYRGEIEVKNRGKLKMYFVEDTTMQSPGEESKERI